MGTVNKCILVGYLGKDPQINHTKAGQAVASFSLATAEKWTDKDGNKQDRTEWHRITAWGKLAEICGEFLTSGKQVYIEGKLHTREWEDKDGVKRQTTEIVASNMTMLGQAGGQSNQGNQDNQGSQSSWAEDFDSEDIPF